MSPNECHSKGLATAARQTARDLRSALAGTPEQAEAAGDPRNLGRISALLDALGGEVAKCGGEACFTRPINGVRAWVPLETFNAERCQTQQLRAEIESLKAALGEIAEEKPSLGSGMIAGRRNAQRAFEIARDALARQGASDAGLN
ncbi:hypothetical protein AEB_P0106 [Altererythrobacter sp. B11]|uniref:hypothetical protein n=1 Tax=Altererythrobacter sp. B11 TaxID=2060312 RepID=UPI000DC6DFED|nr:hypothetical protein [Altererythrobacter sp. B11]BBC70974.1 hypothetical protein AEB_P0106 [Altererythrobacter sp. B11]